MNEVLWFFLINNIRGQIVSVENISFFAFVVFSLCNIELWRHEVQRRAGVLAPKAGEQLTNSPWRLGHLCIQKLYTLFFYLLALFYVGFHGKGGQ